MPRRIDVELTSARDDGTWTWRAAGAREPKGVVASSVLHQGAKVGDVVRAEVEMDVDGITILSVLPPKGKTPAPEGRLEIVGTPLEFEGVTTSLVPKRGGDRGDRGPRRDGDRDRRERGDRVPREGGDRRPRPERSPAEQRAGGGGEQRGPRPPRTERPRREGDRPPRQPRPAQDERQDRARHKRLSPASKHRNAVLESLSPEQRPIAEQLIRGGIPAVRRAIEERNTTAKAEGMPEVKPEPLLSIAEELLPRVKAAEWRDRADAALTDVDTLGLRDLRSVVSSADANARDDEARTIAGSLRDALDRRLKEEREGWIGEITTALEESRLLRALRVSTKPPDPSMRFPADVAMRLSAAASEALSSDTPSDRWTALLEAVVASPVRTTVKPAGLPPNPDEALLKAARNAAGRIPALSQLLGMAIPPPPAPMKRLPPRPPRPQQQQPQPQPQPEQPPQPQPQPEQQPQPQPEQPPEPQPEQQQPEPQPQPQPQPSEQSE